MNDTNIEILKKTAQMNVNVENKEHEEEIECLAGVRKYYFSSTALGGFHRLSYLHYGNPKSKKIIICCHGLTRNALDFEPLAKILFMEDRYNVAKEMQM